MGLGVSLNMTRWIALHDEADGVMESEYLQVTPFHCFMEDHTDYDAVTTRRRQGIQEERVLNIEWH